MRSTRDGDRTVLDELATTGRTSVLIGARMQLSRLLAKAVSSEFLDLLARASALTGRPPSSGEVCRTLRGNSDGVAATDLPAVLAAFSGSQQARWAQWCAYDIWNEALTHEFFGGSRAGRPVYLDLETDVLDRLAATIAAPLGLTSVDSTRAFSNSVARTLDLQPYGAPMLEAHAQAAAAWAASAEGAHSPQDVESPPFVAVLGLFSVAAELMRSGEGMRQTNYYGRLCELLGVDDDPGIRKVRNGFRLHGRRLWAHLNAWLNRAHGTRGIPTAEAFDYRVHVSIPISQALVRAGDRDRLPEFFSSYALNPGQQFSRIDMRDILATWLPGSNLSGALRSLWASSDEARRRIADVVCIELEHWDGSPPVGHSGADRQLRGVLAASYEEVPIPEFSVILAVRDEGQVPVGRYRFSEGSRPFGVSGAVRVTREPGGLARVETEMPQSPADRLLRSALRRSLELTHESGNTTISRPERSVVVFLMDEVRGLFIESARVELGREHLLLVRDDLTGTVNEALGEIARPGFRAVSATAGVPEGWTLYLGVYVRSLLRDASGPLQPLVPLSTTQVALNGGMQLSAGRWHSSAPPDVIAIDAPGRRFAMGLFDESGSGGERGETPLGTHSGEAHVALSEAALSDGNYRIVLNELTPSGNAGPHLTSRALRLRSAESAHLDPPTEVRLAYQGGTSFDGWSALSATSPDETDQQAVRGASVSGVRASLSPVPPLTLPAQLSTRISISDVESLMRFFPGANPSALEAEFEKLLRLGFATADGGRPRLTQKGKAWANQNLGPAARTSSGGDPADAREIDSRFEADLDLILDALIATGGGSWQSLNQLIRYSSLEQWEPLEAARNLSSLGYIDLELDHRSLRPRRWCTTPTTLAVLPDGRSAFITGVRSDRLLDAVDTEARQLGGSTFRHPLSGRPALVQVHGLRDDGYEVLAARTGIVCARDTPQRIAQMLPSIRDVYRQRPELYVPRDASIERFDFDANSWKNVARLEQAGAYRITADTRHYAALADDGLRECDNSVAKHVGAAATGRDIVSYHAADQTLTCLLGARPPGIYERPLVLCTGELPRSLSNGTSVYEGVTAEVAAWLGWTLGPRAWRR